MLHEQGISAKIQSNSSFSHHSFSCASSFPMKFSFAPGCIHIYRKLLPVEISHHNHPFIFSGWLPSVDNLIMGQRQDIALIVKIHHRECQLVIFFLSFFCICLKNKTEYHASIQDPICNQIQVRPSHTGFVTPLIWSGILGKKGGSQGFFPLSPDSWYG